eukprot:IDg2994t1
MTVTTGVVTDRSGCAACAGARAIAGATLARFLKLVLASGRLFAEKAVGAVASVAGARGDGAPPNTFHGACFDIGAAKYVVGRKQAEKYYKYMGILLIMKRGSQKIFKFGEHVISSISQSIFRIPYANNRSICEELDIIDINIPLLMGLDLMGKYKLYIDNVSNMLICQTPRWYHPVTRKFGHIYYEWTHETMYSERELRKMRRHFYHQHPERL